MLFSRNHEREVELDTLRATYEEEISRIIKVGRLRIKDVDKKCDRESNQDFTRGS